MKGFGQSLMHMASVFEAIRPRYPEFKDQVALVTGSSRGIGKGIAVRLAREGMKLVLHGIDADEVAQSTREFESLGVDVLGVQADFTQDHEIERLYQALLDRFGTLDVLVNNAADLRRTRMFDGHMSLLDAQLAVNVRAPYVCAQRAAEIMRPRQRGSIINISSVGGLRAHWAGLPYDMTKGALDAMTRAMALDLGREGIRINGIAPGAIRVERTPSSDHPNIQALEQRIPLVRMGDIQEIASVVAFLASSESSYLTGQILYVDGGITAQLSPSGQPI
jgi:NAD(P)-dependent dehydrogenase (short-subunit alcohol dehydrogenase family)